MWIPDLPYLASCLSLHLPTEQNLLDYTLPASFPFSLNTGPSMQPLLACLKSLELRHDIKLSLGFELGICETSYKWCSHKPYCSERVLRDNGLLSTLQLDLFPDAKVVPGPPLRGRGGRLEAEVNYMPWLMKSACSLLNNQSQTQKRYSPPPPFSLSSPSGGLETFSAKESEMAVTCWLRVKTPESQALLCQ